MAGGQPVTIVPSTQGGLDTYSGSIGATKTLVKASPGQIYGYYFTNPNDAISYVQLFNAAATADVTLGTTAPKLSFGLPAQGGANQQFNEGIEFPLGIVVAVTTARAGLTGPVATVDLNILFK